MEKNEKDSYQIRFNYDLTETIASTGQITSKHFSGIIGIVR
ncbi:MAG: hypothetical protein ACFFD7_02390 [Candidatus Thorarchaeota archaeon]